MSLSVADIQHLERRMDAIEKKFTELKHDDELLRYGAEGQSLARVGFGFGLSLGFIISAFIVLSVKAFGN